VALACAFSACGDDDEDGSPAYGGGATEQTETTGTDSTTAEPEKTETSATATETEDGGGATAPSEGSPEDQPGGAGDEIPASSQALITGRDGRLSPSAVHVPPFIAVRLVLRSADGVEYSLRGGGRTIKAGGEIESASTTFEGLRPGERLVLSGPRGRVVIQPDAEPGP